MSAFRLDYCIHAANILLLAAYSVRNILWLRLFAVASSLMAMPYFLFQPAPLWAAFGWSILFTLINAVQAWRLYIERRPVKLTPEEEEIRRLAFRNLPPRKVLQLISIGTWATASPGERFIERGQPVKCLYLVVYGNVRVTQDGRFLGNLGPGEIVGSALNLSGVLPDVDAAAVDTALTLRWDTPVLQRYLDANPETRNEFQQHLARELSGKLRRLASKRSNADQPA